MKNHKAAFSAENYDRDILNTIPYYDEVYNQIADVVSVVFLNKAVSWLDIGCGTGKMAKVAFEQCNVKRMICTDNSSAMLEVARQKISSSNEVLEGFDRYVFESIVEKVIVGGIDEDGNKDPAQLTFVYKTGLKNSIDGDKFKPQRKNARGRHRTDELCSNASDEDQNMCSDCSDDTC